MFFYGNISCTVDSESTHHAFWASLSAICSTKHTARHL